MAIWKDQTSKKEPVPFTPPPASPAPAPASTTPSPEPVLVRESTMTAPADISPRHQDAARRSISRETRESVIASDISIEGKIDGAGHVRLAGRFKGDVHIQGDLTIEAGAKLTGSVRANSVVIAGEIEGNIEGAARVELLESGVVNGDVKAGTLTVAAGSRMRGRAEFGWGEEEQQAKGPRAVTAVAS
jgi:cytoskeletal protein CcmA (bactofilin family)